MICLPNRIYRRFPHQQAKIYGILGITGQRTDFVGDISTEGCHVARAHVRYFRVESTAQGESVGALTN